MPHRSFTRDTRIVASVPCPRCGAGVGRKCSHPPYRLQPDRPHTERRLAWIEWKREHGL